MDSSSDESFVWTKASTGSDDSDEMNLTINYDESEREVKVKMENQTKHELQNYSIELKEPKRKKRKYKSEALNIEECDSPKKKKIKSEPNSDNDATNKKKKKKNKDISNGSLDDSHSHEDEYLNVRVKEEKENHELLRHDKSKKNKKHDKLSESANENEVSFEINETNSSRKKSKKKKKLNVCEDLSFDIEEVNHSEEDRVHLYNKSPKKKKQKDNSFSDQDKLHNLAVDQQYEDNNIVVQKNTIQEHLKHTDGKNIKNHLNLQSDNNLFALIDKEKNTATVKTMQMPRLSDRIVCEDLSFDIEEVNHSEEDRVQLYNKSPKKKKQKDNSFSDQDKLHNLAVDQQYEDNNIQEHLENTDGKNIKNQLNLQSDNNLFALIDKEKNTATVKTMQMPRLSDRIQFEDDTETDAHSDSHIETENHNESFSSQLKIFLRENNNLQLVSKKSNKNSEISVDDEIWLLKCPHDVDINELNNIDFHLDNKGKIKINGSTYYGNLDDSTKINIMSSKNNKFTIRNVVPKGIYHFRKRLPKPIYHEENSLVNNQTNFIPLPETKCRHPLFGSNYKDVINVSIERLKPSLSNGDISFNSNKKKKKKHKKVNNTTLEITPKVEFDSDTSDKKVPKIEFDPNTLVKKSRKRKQTDNDDCREKKSKRIKVDPDSAEAWESEKAIEENLFNF